MLVGNLWVDVYVNIFIFNLFLVELLGLFF
jgi:hypothetical protein